jgi:hypothetical protein
MPAHQPDPREDQHVTHVRLSRDELARHYVSAKRAVVDHGFIDEIAWQATLQPEAVTRARFLREAAWVVLNAGMREAVVRQKFDSLELIFDGFKPAKVWKERRSIRRRALSVFRHEGKIDAILEIAGRVHRFSDLELARQLQSEKAEEFLRGLPYIGPVTWRHLAKNLGATTAKPDRHLVRLTAEAGRTTVDELCAEISAWVGEPIPVVDIVLWRWSVIGRSECGGSCHPDAVLRTGTI